MIIDVHRHLYSENLKDPQNVENTVKAHEMDRMWLLSANAVTDFNASDEDVLKVCKKYPDFFVPFGYLDFERDPNVVDELREQGFVGLKAIWAYKPYDAEEFMPFYEKAQAYKTPILFHTSVMHGAPEPFRRRPGSALPKNHHVMTLDMIARTFPELIIIAGHMGRPHCEEAINLARCYRNVYLDVQGMSSPPRIQYFRQAYEYGLDDKVLMGTDGGVKPYGKCPGTAWEATLKAVVPRVTDEMVEKLVGGNALRIMKQAGIVKE